MYEPGNILLLIRKKGNIKVPPGHTMLVDSPGVVAYIRLKAYK